MADGECWGGGCRHEAVQRREVGGEVEIRTEGRQERWSYVNDVAIGTKKTKRTCCTQERRLGMGKQI